MRSKLPILKLPTLLPIGPEEIGSVSGRGRGRGKRVADNVASLDDEVHVISSKEVEVQAWKRERKTSEERVGF